MFYPYLAHVKWFVDSHRSYSGHGDIAYLPLVPIIVAIGFIAARLCQRIFAPYEKRISKRLSKYAVFLPDIIRMATGLSMIIFSLNHYVLAPNSGVDGSGWVLLQLLIGLGWIFGVMVRPLSVSATLLYLPIVATEPINALEHLEILAAAIYLFAYGGGKLTLQTIFGASEKPIARITGLASNAYRILIGISLSTLALTEKIFALPLAQEFLKHHHWNFLAGLGISDVLFITIMGSLELLFGLLIILNVIPRLVVLAIFGAMVTTAIVLGVNEVYGHLFAVGLVAFVWLQPAKQKQTPKAK